MENTQEIQTAELKLTEFGCNECHHDGASPHCCSAPCSHCALRTQKTQMQRESTTLGSKDTLVKEQWALGKLNDQALCRSGPTACSCCTTNGVPVKASTVCCLCFWVSSSHNGQWMERKVLGLDGAGPPKLPWWWSNFVLSDGSQCSSQLQSSCRDFLDHRAGSSSSGSTSLSLWFKQQPLPVMLPFWQQPFSACVSDLLSGCIFEWSRACWSCSKQKSSPSKKQSSSVLIASMALFEVLHSPFNCFPSLQHWLLCQAKEKATRLEPTLTTARLFSSSPHLEHCKDAHHPSTTSQHWMEAAGTAILLPSRLPGTTPCCVLESRWPQWRRKR